MRTALNAAARDNLIPLTIVLVVLYLVAGCFRLNVVGTLDDAIVLGEFASAGVTLALLVVTLRCDVRGQWVHPTLVAVAIVATADSLMQLFRSGAGWDTTNLALVIGATGLVSLSVVASALIYSVIWVGWLWCAMTHPSGEWLHYGFFLLWATAIAAVVQAARTSLLRRLVQTETQNRERLEDLVAERTRQLKTSLEQLRHSERLASVGTLAAGIAHEINNPVGMILLSAEQLLVSLPPGDVGNSTPVLNDIIDNAKRCGQIVKGVLRFARHEPAQRSPDDLNVVVGDALSLTRALATKRGAVLSSTLAADLPQVLLNRIELEQVFVNLICNGIEAALDKAPLITIVTETAPGAVRVTVSDNGRGIRAEDRGHIFDPFFTTRQDDGGTGLGLSLTYGIITDHGGTIRVEDVDGGGTAMIVELPIHNGEAMP
jgi:signal transduction histidine kinase